MASSVGFSMPLDLIRALVGLGGGGGGFARKPAESEYLCLQDTQPFKCNRNKCSSYIQLHRGGPRMPSKGKKGHFCFLHPQPEVIVFLALRRLSEVSPGVRKPSEGPVQRVQV